MNMDDLEEVLCLFQRNVKKLQTNVNVYEGEVDAALKSLKENWSHVGYADRGIIPVHNSLLSSVNEVNECIIKLNLHINLNRAVDKLKDIGTNEKFLTIEPESTRRNIDNVNHTNLDGIEVGDLDAISAPSEQAEQRPVALNQLIALNPCTSEPNPIVSPTPSVPKPDNILCANTPAFVPVAPTLPRQSKLLPPKGGKQISSNETYDLLTKNISKYVKDSVIQVTLMHLNMADNCIFVGYWGQDSVLLKKMLACQMPLEEVHQLPDFGEIFAVYDAQELIMPRVLVNAESEGGGYDAYLVDYGEHIHMDGEEVIYSLPSDVKMLPAEAIKCYVHNCEISDMSKYIYKDVQLRVLENNGNDLEVEILENTHAEGETLHSHEIKAEDKTESVESLKTQGESGTILNPEEMAQLETIEKGTSDAVVAVLGFKPKDDERICRFYDPKINGCFKGSNCHKLHQHFAPHGATKDKELADALPETIYVTPAPKQLGSTVRVLVTYINSPTQLYVQFVDEAPPLVWSEKDVPESQRHFRRAPLELDLVLALYNDGCFYRAQVIEQMDGVFKIFYVDYGNTEFVSIKSLAQCGEAARIKPHRAVCCFIDGIAGNSVLTQRRSVESIEFLKSKILNVELDVLLLNELPDGYLIRLLGLYNNVCAQMIKRGYVEPNNDDLNRSHKSFELI